MRGIGLPNLNEQIVSLLPYMAFAGTCGTALAAVLWRKLQATRTALENQREAINHLQEGFYRSTLDGKQILANPALVRLNGYRTEQEQLDAVKNIGAEWYVEPGRREEFQQQLFERGRITSFVSEVYRHKTRERIWVSENARLVTDHHTGAPLYYEGTVRDITDEMRLKETRDRLEKLAANLPGGLFQIIQQDSRKIAIRYMSDTFADLFGLGEVAPDKILKCITSRIEPADLKRYNQAFAKSARELTSLDQQIRYTGSDGKKIWIHVTATPEAEDDRTIVWHGHALEITRQKEIEQRFEHMANFDTLTSLPKRSVLEDRVKAAISGCNRRGEYAALLFIDLDNFKQLNDTLGHDAGDELLRQIAQRLRSQTRACDTVARFGGDEFVIVIDNLGTDPELSREKAAAFAGKLLGSFGESFDLSGREYFSSPSIGIALIGPEQATLEEILSRADSAMYQAKKGGRNTFVIFDEKRENSGAIANYLRELKGAAGRGEFHLVFQPQIDGSGRISGAEAFIRWEHPEHGIIAPSDFMPVAEKSGLLTEINEWVLNQAIARLASWQKDKRLSHLSLSVNLSVQQFSLTGFPERLKELVEASGIDPDRLTLELPESLLTRNMKTVGNRMRQIKKTGVRFSLDDFGTGAASLASLNHLPVDEIKIDGLLVSSIENDDRSRSMIAGILGIAHALKLHTVAEHVGNALQHAYLRERGCDGFQGYHFHPPLSADVFEAVVATRPRHDKLPLAS